MGFRPQPLGFVTATGERRDANRYASKGSPVLLGWLEGETCQTSRGVLEDVSQSGAKLVVDVAPPAGVLALVHLPFGDFPGKVKGVVVGVAAVGKWPWSLGKKSFTVRLRFTEPCPYDFFKAAIDGFVRNTDQIDCEFDGFEPRDWA